MTFKNEVTNTVTETAESPGTPLARLVVVGLDAQERRGRVEFERSEVLPTRIEIEDRRCTDEDLATLGFELGPVVPGDGLFRFARLPPGWRKVSTGHSMWTYVVDDRGLRRMSVFYKASAWDRDAFGSVLDPGMSAAQALLNDGTPVPVGVMTPAEVEGARSVLAGSVCWSLVDARDFDRPSHYRDRARRALDGLRDTGGVPSVEEIVATWRRSSFERTTVEEMRDEVASLVASQS